MILFAVEQRDLSSIFLIVSSQEVTRQSCSPLFGGGIHCAEWCVGAEGALKFSLFFVQHLARKQAVWQQLLSSMSRQTAAFIGE